MDINIPILEVDSEILRWVNFVKGGPGSGAQAGHEFEGNQWGTGGGKAGAVGGKGGKALTIPSNCGARDFSVAQTKAQIGTMNIMACSGGRVDTITTAGGGRVVGLSLPDSSGGHSVRVYLGNDDTYTVQRVGADGTVQGQESGIYADEVGEQCYQASSWRSNPFGGHTP